MNGEPDARDDDVSTAPYFGGCPHCGKTDGFFNLGRAHFFVCDEHPVKWFVGENLFRGWKEKTREVWEPNARQFGHYTDVEPATAHASLCDHAGKPPDEE